MKYELKHLQVWDMITMMIFFFFLFLLVMVPDAVPPNQ